MFVEAPSPAAAKHHTVFLRPRFNIVALDNEMAVQVRAQKPTDREGCVPTSFVPGREKARA
jgi:hypothetical protein